MPPEEPIFLENEVEANLLQSLLDEKGIPYFVKAYRDPGRRDGIWTFNTAWGHLECAEEHRDLVRQILADLRASRGERR
jgi:hypothetical protein